MDCLGGMRSQTGKIFLRMAVMEKRRRIWWPPDSSIGSEPAAKSCLKSFCDPNPFMHQANPWDTRESGTAPAGARAGLHFMCPGLGKDKAASYAGSGNVCIAKTISCIL